MNTVALPDCAVHIAGPQQGACRPRSPTRSAGSPFTFTSGEPRVAGPNEGWGHPGQACASAWVLALSPSLPCPGMVPGLGTVEPEVAAHRRRWIQRIQLDMAAVSCMISILMGLSFRPLQISDLPLVQGWLSMPHID